MAKQDLTGMKFGKLTVLEKIPSGKRTYYKCICDCENKTIKNIRGDSLTSKHNPTKSCGCLSKETQFKSKHNLINHRLYNIWSGMKDRCLNKNSKKYSSYGGRGIEVYKEWLDKENGFINFYNWAMSNGYSDELSIDRIDVNGNYEPSNCRWATNKEQQNNTRINNNIEIDGVIKSISMWSQESGVSRQTILRRLEKGITGRDLLNPITHIADKHSGVKGIRWDKSKNAWRVFVKIDGKWVSKFEGKKYYKDVDEAIQKQKEVLNQLRK